MITLLIPYFGSLPSYFQLYLDSLAVNPILTVVLITDIDLTAYQVPPNLRKVKMTLDQLRVRIQQFLKKMYGKTAEVVQTPYKLVDFKIMFPLIFEDLYDSEHVGWGDIDVIYGNLASFLSDADIIGGYHGHFTALRNITVLKNLFLTVPKLYDLCIDKRAHITDEIAFREPLLNAIKTHGFSMCYLQSSFCDIVPPCFFDMFRPDFASYSKNFFNVAKPAKNISYLHRTPSGLTTFYDDGENQPTSYVHLQKRKMTGSVTDSYYITDSAFVDEQPTSPNIIPARLFMTWATKDYPPLMRENVNKIVAASDMSVYIYDDQECEQFLTAHFPPEVVATWRSLIPGAYKADLWRLCILYHFGGMYMDIKLKPTIRLSTLLTREYFVSDGKGSVYNGFMVSKHQNPMLLQGIVQIIKNAKNFYYGETPWCPTGPRLLGRLYKDAIDKEPLYMAHYGPQNYEHIKLGTNTILEEYPGYRAEHSGIYYQDAWASRAIYNNEIDLSRARSWPTPMLSILDADSQKIRLHLPAIPYTITTDEYSHDAFTGKVKRFSKMLSKYEVIHYGVEGSQSGATYQVDLLTQKEWTELRIQSLMGLNKITRADAEAMLDNPKTLVGILANYSTPLFEEFNRRLRVELKKNYRNPNTDIVCIPLGHSYNTALEPNYTVIETGIGYNNSHRNFRIFESYSWMSKTLGEEKKWPNNYWFVIPHSFDSSEFADSYNSSKPKIGFLGRIVREKGCGIIAEVAKRFPQIDFVLCGQGDPAPFLKSSNISYLPPIHGKKRSDFLGSCVATMCPTIYLEPFGCSAVESQLCGTPVITVDNGAYVETVEQFKSGLRCHTLADFCRGVQMALDGAFDRKYVRDRAVRLYDMHNVAPQYDYVFQSVLDIVRPHKNGWYSPDCHLLKE